MDVKPENMELCKFPKYEELECLDMMCLNSLKTRSWIIDWSSFWNSKIGKVDQQMQDKFQS